MPGKLVVAVGGSLRSFSPGPLPGMSECPALST